MTLLAYTPPTVQRIETGPLNPFRHGGGRSCPDIDGVPIGSLVKEFGSPLFVFSETTLRRKAREANRAFTRRYPDVQFAWSYKTNYLNAICQVFHQEGSIAEVVSEFEYEKARHNGIPGNKIIFNGPYKTRAGLERAVTEGAMIQVDNLDELLTLTDIAKTRSEPVPITLRLHVNTGTHEVWSKFGFNADSDEVMQIFRRISMTPGLRLRGLHCHVGTFILDPNAYRIAATRLVELALSAHEMGLGLVEYLNLGGGFASLARLHFQYLPPEQVVPSFDQYAEAICDTIQSLWPKQHRLPKLYLESGRSLVDEAGYLVSSVVAVKKRSLGHAPALATNLAAYGKGAAHTRSGGAASEVRNALVVDAGVNLLYTTGWYQPTILPVRACAEPPVPTTVYGCLCMNIDVIREETPLPGLTMGDQVVLHPVGAYNITQAMQFIQYRPAVVMIDTEGVPRLIRQREDLRYVQELEKVPTHLTPVAATPAS